MQEVRSHGRRKVESRLEQRPGATQGAVAGCNVIRQFLERVFIDLLQIRTDDPLACISRLPVFLVATHSTDRHF